MPEDITLGSTWKHRREGYPVVVKQTLRMKDDDGVHWRDAVGYTREGTEQILVRSEVDFLLKFTKEV